MVGVEVNVREGVKVEVDVFETIVGLRVFVRVGESVRVAVAEWVAVKVGVTDGVAVKVRVKDGVLV